MKNLFLIIFISYLLFPHKTFTQGFFNETQVGGNFVDIGDLVTEKIQIISATKRIFIVTNQKNSFGKGDFLTFFLDGKPFARALCAKLQNESSGTKILKIYNSEIWKTIKEGMNIQILKGDDSYFRAKVANNEADLKIQSEEDLFNETILDEDLNLEENDKRGIRTDNVLSIVYGQVEGLNNNGSAAGYYQFNVAWDFQIEDNIWTGISYGQNLIADYPTPGLDTKLSNITLKIKYTIKAPLFSFVMPYVGYQLMDASSPGAGRDDPNCTINCPGPADLELEVRQVSDLKKSTVIFGISVLKRLVPAWFVKVNVGTDIMGIGLALEF